jgi:hypothetical protein
VIVSRSGPDLEATTEVLLRTRDGRESRADAVVVRVSPTARALRVGVPMVAGLTFGALALPVPGLHLFAPWFLPLLGIVMGTYLARVSATVARVGGPCPRCDARIDATGLGSIGAEPVWLKCDACGTPVELRVPA